MTYKTEQETFWAGQFGNDYIKRNSIDATIRANIRLFSRILERTSKIKSVVEFGSNIGSNLMAIQTLLPDIRLSAIEININCIPHLQTINNCTVIPASIMDYKTTKKYDFVLIKGVLIHINPDELQNVYQKLYESSNRYICIAEYYNPTPVEINYRGYYNKLFKRDFTGELMDKYSELELIDYGFIYHRDNMFPQDDLTWFLLKKI
ncbi:pseudaminic acid biosynthesis-associated methylase [Candidatus Magnetomorum sp. HK-1]|nr:pseudaminic acid biosynthesis-associated methylase [Candidatus Magnetomorum sp. HK-1]